MNTIKFDGKQFLANKLYYFQPKNTLLLCNNDNI